MRFTRLIQITMAGAAICASAFSADSAGALERRKLYWEEIRKILPHSTSDQLTGRINAYDKTWEDWVQRTGELPPDFASMPSNAELPDPLLLHENGKTIPV